MSVSLDGFAAGPNQSEENPLGEGGMQLHEWAFALDAWREEHGLEGGTTFNFVTDGVESAMARAREAAGEKDVELAGGANVVQQCLRAGLVDDLELHVAPVILGAGERLLDDLGGVGLALEPTRTVEAPGVTHLSYRVTR